MKVSENIVVRRLAGASLLAIAPALTPDRRNEVAVELSKVLETGQTEISQYIPQYLGQFALWLTPRELDEMRGSDADSSSPPPTPWWWPPPWPLWASMLEHYAVYAQPLPRVPVRSLELPAGERLAGLLLKGLASYRRSPCGRRRCRSWASGLFASQRPGLRG